jgi:hypothetical protein
MLSRLSAGPSSRQENRSPSHFYRSLPQSFFNEATISKTVSIRVPDAGYSDPTSEFVHLLLVEDSQVSPHQNQASEEDVITPILSVFINFA